jgi:hypothetical protein
MLNTVSSRKTGGGCLVPPLKIVRYIYTPIHLPSLIPSTCIHTHTGFQGGPGYAFIPFRADKTGVATPMNYCSYAVLLRVLLLTLERSASVSVYGIRTVELTMCMYKVECLHVHDIYKYMVAESEVARGLGSSAPYLTHVHTPFECVVLLPIKVSTHNTYHVCTFYYTATDSYKYAGSYT